MRKAKKAASALGAWGSRGNALRPLGSICPVFPDRCIIPDIAACSHQRPKEKGPAETAVRARGLFSYSVLLPAMEMAARATAQIPHRAARLLWGPLMPNRNCPTGQTRLPLARLELPLRPYPRLRVQVVSCGPALCKQTGAGGKERSFTHVAQIGSFVIADPVCKRQAPCLAQLCPTLLSDRLPIAI
jgi:hypothetical protein